MIFELGWAALAAIFTFSIAMVVWGRNGDDVYTNENVTIKTNDEVIYGSGFKSDSKFEKYYINDVKGNFSFNVENWFLFQSKKILN